MSTQLETKIRLLFHSNVDHDAYAFEVQTPAGSWGFGTRDRSTYLHLCRSCVQYIADLHVDYLISKNDHGIAFLLLITPMP